MELKELIVIPADVPENKHEKFIKNYNDITRKTGKCFIFSCDHKIERLNNDFYGPSVHPHALHPEHIFRIASSGNIGALATHFGMITRYAKQYPAINYIIKLNATPSLAPREGTLGIVGLKNGMLCSVEDVIKLKKDNSSLSIPGVGISVYLGNNYESEHLADAAHAINHAHNEGLVTVAWIYLDGTIEEHHRNNSDLIAGSAGIGLSLGSDFVIINKPITDNPSSDRQLLTIASAASGNSKLLCSGGKKMEKEAYLYELYAQIHEGYTAGAAVGRNIFQHSLPESIAFTHALATIIYDNADVATALNAYHAKLEKSHNDNLT